MIARVFVLTIAAGIVGSLGIGGVSAAALRPGVVAHHMRQAESRAALAHWTPARMARALRHDGSDPDAAGAEAVTPTLAPPTQVPRPYTNMPDRTVGKVFFTKSGGQDGTCSGAVIASTSGDMVVTAGRCVGKDDHFHTNVVFVPAYGSSDAAPRPYGTWTARTVAARTAWLSHSDVRQDVGFIVLSMLAGKHIKQVVGAQGIRFHEAASQEYRTIGYPKAAPFDGSRQGRCDSSLRGRDDPPGIGPRTLRVACTMAAGATGGAWIVDIAANGRGFVQSVSSYRVRNLPNALFGPLFGSEANDLYDFAQGM
jgi:hypothetical protein